jgi:hypothetical protein
VYPTDLVVSDDMKITNPFFKRGYTHALSQRYTRATVDYIMANKKLALSVKRTKVCSLSDIALRDFLVLSGVTSFKS